MTTSPIAPGSSPLQEKTSRDGSYPPVPKKCVVTGGTGFVGLRLVEMLVERGAEKVVAVDVVSIENLPKEIQPFIWKHPAIEYVKGDVTRIEDLKAAFEGADCVWHIAAAVGPFHPKKVYEKVNYEGTKNVVEACKQMGVKKLIMSSSPSTRMLGTDIDGLSEADLPTFEEMKGKYLQAYAETKFLGEKYCTESCSPELLTIAVAPHQVYGPRDNLFIPNFLEAGGLGKLRIFSKPSTGYGKNKVCFTHVDNYCHGLIIAEKALTADSVCKGKFYIVTDADTHPFKEGYAYFWDELSTLLEHQGFQSLHSRFKLPHWLLISIAYISIGIGSLIGQKFRLTPFTVKMTTMHRWFDVSAAKEDLAYEPIVPFREGWTDASEWFKGNWLPSFKERQKAGKARLVHISGTTEQKINIQTAAVSKKKQ